MPTYCIKIIKSIDPNADIEAVFDIADENFRYLGDMSRDDWAACIEASKSQ